MLAEARPAPRCMIAADHCKPWTQLASLQGLEDPSDKGKAPAAAAATTQGAYATNDGAWCSLP